MQLVASVVADVGAWDADTVEDLAQAYAHTADNPMRFGLQHWHLALRVARMVHTRIFRSVQLACQAFASLKVTRKKVTQALGHWVGAQDQVALANHVPRELQIGKYGEGRLTLKQKCDLVHWVRAREKLNIPVRKVEAQSAMLKFMLLSTGDCVPEQLEGPTWRAAVLPALQQDARVEHVYQGWRRWNRDHVADHAQPVVRGDDGCGLRPRHSRSPQGQRLDSQYSLNFAFS